MSNLWTWGGEYIGHREGDDLWSHNGNHIGRFYGDEVYGTNGNYLGEVMNESRLITSLSKKNINRGGFSSYASRVGWVPYASYVGNVMYAGYEDFPSLDELEA